MKKGRKTQCVMGIVAGMVAVLSMGCSMSASDEPELSYTPTVKSVDNARSQARDLASELLRMADIQGEVSDPGPGVSSCHTDPDMENNLYIIRAGWSIYDRPVRTLEEGMSNLRSELTQQGWEITEDGEVNNAARSQHILFENHEVEYAVDIELYPGGDGQPQLSATMVSACFRTPEGESPRNQY
jgi:hypothetical protein